MNRIRFIFFLLFPLFLQAGTHNVPPLNPGQGAGFTVTATVTGATRTAFKADYNEENFGLGQHPLALYTASGSVQIRIDVEYHGSTPIEQVKLNGQESYSDIRTIPLPADLQGMAYAFGMQIVEISGFFVLQKVDASGEPYDEYMPFTTQFIHEIRIYKELWVELRMPTTGFQWWVESRRISPSIATNAENFDVVNLGWSAWPDVGVELVASDKLVIEPSGWFRTDEYGRASFRTAAPLNAFTSEGIGLDWYSEEVEVRAVKSTNKIETTDRLQVPFCVVTLANRAWHRGNVDGIGGGELTPLGPPMLLLKGDRVQIGTSALPGFLRVQFANGYKTELEATGMDGFVAIIGDGDVTRGRSLISLNIQNTAYDIQTDPRRFGRMVTYKGAGMAVDYALGTPDVVGFVSDTPGSLIEKALIKWVEPEYKYIAPRPPQPKSFGESPQSDPELVGEVRESAYIAVEFFSDGSLRVDNHGAPVQLSTAEGVVSQMSTGGATWLSRSPEQHLLPSSAMTPPASWGVNLTGGWTHSPAVDEIVLTEGLFLSVGHENAAALLWQRATVRLDGTDITAFLDPLGTFGADDYRLEGLYPHAATLAPGSHLLRCDVEDIAGNTHTLEVPFTFSPPTPAAAAPAVRAVAEGVWLSWDRSFPGAAGARLLRRELPDGTPSVAAPLLKNGGYWDASPTAEAEYWLEWIDTSENVLATSPAATVSWHADLSPAPAVSDAAALELSPCPAGVLLSLPAEALPGFQRWRLLAADTEAGPFEDLFPDEYQVPAEWIDTAVAPGSSRHYKLLALSIDGTPQVTDPTPVAFVNPLTPLDPSGFSLHRASGGILLGWNPVTDVRANVVRIYEVVNQEPVLRQELPVSTPRHLLAGVSSGIFFVTLAGPGGEESGASQIGVSEWHEAATEASVISMAAAEVSVREGEGVCSITVQRSGNLNEPVFVPWTLQTNQYPYATFGEDLAFRSEFLPFAPGQTQAVISLPLLPDAVNEEFEYVDVVFGTPQGPASIDPESGATRVKIEESDVILFADYQTQGRVQEDAATATLTVERLWPSNRNIQVALTLADPAGTAQPGVDFQDTRPWTFTFAPGETRASLQIPMQDNLDKDGHRILNLTLASPAGGSSLAAGFDFYELTIRDNETLPGQFRPAGGQTLYIAAANSLEIPVERVGGTDGPLSGMVMSSGGSLNWGTVGFSDMTASDGESSASVTVTLDRDAFNAESGGLAPYTVVTIGNDEEPYESHEVLVIFPPAGDAGTYTEWWQALTGAAPGPGQDNPLNDSNGNGLPDFAELALGGDPAAPSPAPRLVPDTTYGSLNLPVRVHTHPRLVIVGEFSTHLPGGFPLLHGGYWMPEDGEEGISSAEFQTMVPGNVQFGRLRFYWLGE